MIVVLVPWCVVIGFGLEALPPVSTVYFDVFVGQILPFDPLLSLLLLLLCFSAKWSVGYDFRLLPPDHELRGSSMFSMLSRSGLVECQNWICLFRNSGSSYLLSLVRKHDQN
jgi:hypothetical protein